MKIRKSEIVNLIEQSIVQLRSLSYLDTSASVINMISRLYNIIDHINGVVKPKTQAKSNVIFELTPDLEEWDRNKKLLSMLAGTEDDGDSKSSSGSIKSKLIKTIKQIKVRK